MQVKFYQNLLRLATVYVSSRSFPESSLLLNCLTEKTVAVLAVLTMVRNSLIRSSLFRSTSFILKSDLLFFVSRSLFRLQKNEQNARKTDERIPNPGFH